MSMLKLAFWNCKSSFKNYLSLIVSLSFTILILSNFINLVYSDVLGQLGEWQSENIKIVLQVLSFVIGCFMLFFIWYATNVFLTRRKKEIGIYAFMGLSNQKIGKLYMIEIALIGLVSLAAGMGFGILTSQLFVMILMRLSDIAIPISFHFTGESVLLTCLIFTAIYLVFTVKGYVNIVRSSVLDMISANRQNEYVKQNSAVLLAKAALGIALLGAGFYLATKEAGIEAITNVLAATILVVIGIYLLFGGFIPLIFQLLAKNKAFLYRKERNLWINTMIFRMKKNYRTYAMVCVLMLCAVTALAFGFAMKNRSDNINHFQNTYTYQIVSDQKGYRREFTDLIQQKNEIAYASEAEVLAIPNELTDNIYANPYALLSYSQVRQIAEETGLEFTYREPADDEFIELNKLYLMSFVNDSMENKKRIQEKAYTAIGSSTVPYLGYFQESMDFMIVNDQVYEQLRPLGQRMYFYNYKLANPKDFAGSVEDIQSSQHCMGLVKIDPLRNENAWINMLFSVSVFMFMVFVLAGGSILFMKIYNDAFEEKERCRILQKIGVDEKTLHRAIAAELKTSYVIPLLVMTVSSYFSVQAIANVMKSASLLGINAGSALIIYGVFAICYFFSKICFFNILKV